MNTNSPGNTSFLAILCENKAQLQSMIVGGAIIVVLYVVSPYCLACERL